MAAKIPPRRSNVGAKKDSLAAFRAGENGEGKQSDMEKPIKKSPWLNAWHDPVAGFSSVMEGCIQVIDIAGDGDAQLLVADQNRKLIIYKGTQRVQEISLVDDPTAVATFYTDRAIPRTPAIAVASGSNVYIYRHLKPYFKFNVPACEIDSREKAIWEEIDKSGGDIKVAEQTYQALSTARENGVLLSSLSQDYLAIDEPGQRRSFLADQKADILPIQQTVITCMETLKKTSEDDDAISCLVLGLENKQVLILDHQGANILVKNKIKGIPVFIAVSGIYEGDWRLMIACRDNKIYTIKGGEVRNTAVVVGQAIELESHPCALLRIDKYLIVGTMDQRVTAYSIRGKKEFSFAVSSPIIAMEPMLLRRNRVLSAFIVALANGELRVYKESALLDTLQLDSEAALVRFGKYGREDNTLVILHRSGSLSIKILQRNAFADLATLMAPLPPPEQEIPLNVPKKTKLFVEQTQREQEQAIDMHRIFQWDLARLKLRTAQAYVKVITEGHQMGVNNSSNGNVSIRLNAAVMGLGPRFKLNIDILNEGQQPLYNLPITIAYNQALYRVTSESLITIPLVLPGVAMKVEFSIYCKDPTGAADAIKIFVLNKGNKSSIPLVSAIVNMPLSELEED